MQAHADILNLSALVRGTQGKVRCPFCTPTRQKKHLKDMTITFGDDGAVLYCCHHCGESGAVQPTGPRLVRPHSKKKGLVMAPAAAPMLDATQEQALAYLQSRGISPDTARKCGITQASRWFSGLGHEDQAVVYPYLQREGIPYAWKFRAISAKDFSAAGSPQSLWLHHLIEDWTSIIICEGEMDAATCIEAGLTNATSLPCGAMNPIEKNHERRFRWMENHHDRLMETQKVVLALDGDPSGDATVQELARRFGRDKVWTVTYPEGCKDLNDVLRAHGPARVVEVIEQAEPMPIDGSVPDADVIEEATALRVAPPKGIATGLAALDTIYSVPEGRLTIVTGHPGSGKSQLLDQIMLNIAETEGWRFGIVGFENSQGQHMNELIHMYLGKSPYRGTYNQATDYEVEQGERFISRHFKWMNTAGDQLATLAFILGVARYWVQKYGIKALVIDPFNYIARDPNVSEVEWISSMLTQVRQFCATYNVHVWFVAHPTKMHENAAGVLPVPTGYDVSGSAAWYAKADLGLTVHRPDAGAPGEQTELHVWKAKRRWMGRLGRAHVYYQNDAHRYADLGQAVRVLDLKEPVPF